jgi:tRNA-modifying protein YgfZ
VDTFVAPIPTRRIDVTGDDRVRYLEDVTTQHLVDVPVTHVRSALVLDGHGAPTAMFDVVVLGDRLVLLVPDDAVAATVMDVLAMRTFLLDARFEQRDEVVVAVRGDDADATVSVAGLTTVAGRCRQAGDLLLVSQPGGIDVVGPAAAVDDAVTALRAGGAREGAAADLDAWRVAAGVPAWGVEVVAPHLPEEVGLLPTHVHLAKGCYPGQEAVARMWMLGRPRRRLAAVTIAGVGDGGADGSREGSSGGPDGDVMDDARTEVAPGWTAGAGRNAATVTTVDAAAGRALAFVPSAATPGDRFDGDDGNAIVVESLVGDEPSPPGHDPKVTRRRDRPRG